MVFKLTRSILLAVTLLAAWSLVAPDASGRDRPPNDLFYNFYVPPGPSGGVPAQLYLCPRPTPPMVGHTWVTYQPFMPHEFLYRHCRCYFHQHPDKRWTKTLVVWW
ncbi:MAG TPA: hypothetical protein EYP56_19740 [Planctomycetaceae bacterium]|nr:hypothetical protein [Planctomycetaceae bacterium]